jgi:hypothetical protein
MGRAPVTAVLWTACMLGCEPDLPPPRSPAPPMHERKTVIETRRSGAERSVASTTKRALPKEPKNDHEAPKAKTAAPQVPPRFTFTTPDNFSRSDDPMDADNPDAQSAYVSSDTYVADFTILLSPRSKSTIDPRCAHPPTHEAEESQEDTPEDETENDGPHELDRCDIRWQGHDVDDSLGLTGGYHAEIVPDRPDYILIVSGKWLYSNEAAVRPAFEAFVKSIRIE